ncbi:MAG: vWA domain-containing protein, partial [Ilumatobacteraceae bacterium]
DRGDLGGVYGEIVDELNDIVDDERHAVENYTNEAKNLGDERRVELAEQTARDRNFRLDMLPADLAGKVAELQRYDFQSKEAQQRFEQLLDKLRQQLMQQNLDQMSGAMQNMTAADMQRMKDMLSELNKMLERRQHGEDPQFENFMQNFGDFFPESPGTLDELLEIMARRMAAAQAMLNSMTSEQRAQLLALSDQLLEDMDLRWQMDQLAQNLQSMFPEMSWNRRYDFEGETPMGFQQAMQSMQELSELDQLENLMKNASNPATLAEVDLDRVRELLGDDAALSLQRLAKLAKILEDAGFIERKEGHLALTPRGLRKIGANALKDLFGKLAVDTLGEHQINRLGIGHERIYDNKPYEYGDSFQLDLQGTLRNALRRSGPGVPVKLSPEDFEIERTEHLTRSSTVLMLDLSLSMPMRDNFLPAKKVAMALHSLISMQFPRDYLGIVGFGEVARELKADQLPEVSWDFVYGTNMQHAFALSRRMLDRQSGTKQIIMITDGEPTAHITSSGDVFFNYPPARETVEATLREAVRCTRAEIRINTFMLDADAGLRGFIERLTKINRGRAFFTSPDTLGDYVLVDFLEHKRQLSMHRNSRAH